MEPITTITAIGGVLTGFIGNILTSYTNYKMKRLDMENRQFERQHEVAMVEVQTRNMIAEVEANIRVTQVQAEGAVDLEETRAFTASQKTINKGMFAESYMDRIASAPYIGGWVVALICMAFACVDVLKGFIRPVVTIYLLAVTSWMTYLSYKMVGAMNQTGITFEALAVELLQAVVYSILYLTMAIVGWWFCDRRVTKFMGKFIGSKVGVE